MKKLPAVLSIVLLLLMLSGCVVVGWGGGRSRVIRGTGEITSSEHEVGAYDALDIRGFYKIVYSTAPSSSVPASAHRKSPTAAFP